MDEREAASITAEAVAVLRRVGARFAYLHGSRVDGRARADSDLDIAAFFGNDAPPAHDVLLPVGVDLLVLDRAPLELAGRVAVQERLLFESDQVARIRWGAMTRKIYFDERPRMQRAHAEFRPSVAGG